MIVTAITKRNLGLERRLEDIVVRSEAAARLSRNKNTLILDNSRPSLPSLYMLNVSIGYRPIAGNSWAFYDYFSFVYERHMF